MFVRPENSMRTPGILIVLLFLVLAASAQEIGEGAKLQDQFGRIPNEDIMARLDSFGYKLLSNPGTTGYVVTYGPAGDGSGTAESINQLIVEYMVTDQGLPLSLLKTVNGGRFSSVSESQTELWLLSPGAVLPKFSDFGNPASEASGKIAEIGTYGCSESENIARPIFDTSLAGFADAVRVQPAMQPYIVGYQGRNASPGEWRRLAEEKLQTLSSLKVDQERVKLLFGGDLKEGASHYEGAKVELWLLPPEAPSPVIGSLREELPDKPISLSVGCYPHPPSGDREVEKLAKVLEYAATFSLVIIYEHRLDSRYVDENADTLKQVRLIETKLLKKGFGAHRIVLTKEVLPQGTPGEISYSLGDVRFWLLPPGSILPDEAFSEHAIR